MDYEEITSQIVSKSNGYQAVPDGQGGRRIIKSAQVRAYEKEFDRQCKVYRDRNICRPFILHLIVYESSWAYDLDGAFKVLLDMLQTVHAIKNDNLCVGIHAEKRIDRDHPRILYGIEELEPRLF